MQKKIVWQWEPLDDSTQRAKVIGGWLVMRLGAVDIEKNKKIQFRESLVFVSDRDHEWVVQAPFVEPPAAAPTVKATDFDPK